MPTPLKILKGNYSALAGMTEKLEGQIYFVEDEATIAFDVQNAENQLERRTIKAMGTNALSPGFGAFSHGESVTAEGERSHASGLGTHAKHSDQFAIGRFNIIDMEGSKAFVVGNGSADNSREDIFWVKWDGSTGIKNASEVADTSSSFLITNDTKEIFNIRWDGSIAIQNAVPVVPENKVFAITNDTSEIFSISWDGTTIINDKQVPVLNDVTLGDERWPIYSDAGTLKVCAEDFVFYDDLEESPLEPLVDNFVRKAGDTMTGSLNVEGQIVAGTNGNIILNNSGHISGATFQLTANNHSPNALGKITVQDDNGWLYHRTLEEIRKDINAQSAPTFVESVLSTTGWSTTNKTYSFENTYPNATYNIEISVGNDITLDAYNAFGNARIIGSSTGNVIKALGNLPQIDIPIIIKVIKK